MKCKKAARFIVAFRRALHKFALRYRQPLLFPRALTSTANVLRNGKNIYISSPFERPILELARNSPGAILVGM